MTPFSQNYASALRVDALKEIATWADVAEEGCRANAEGRGEHAETMRAEADKWGKLGELLQWAIEGAA